MLIKIRIWTKTSNKVDGLVIWSHHLHLQWKFKLFAVRFTWIFTEGDGIESRLPFKIFSTLNKLLKYFYFANLSMLASFFEIAIWNDWYGMLRDFWDLAELEIAKKYVEIRDESFQLCFFCADRPTCSAYHFQIAHQEFCWLMWQLSQMLHHNLVPKHSSWIPKHGNAIMSTLICYLVLKYVEMASLDNI